MLAITVKPGNKLQQPPTSVENRVEHTKPSDGDRVVRYIPQQFSPSSHRHHHLPLDNHNLVRVNEKRSILYYFIKSYYDEKFNLLPRERAFKDLIFILEIQKNNFSQ